MRKRLTTVWLTQLFAGLLVFLCAGLPAGAQATASAELPALESHAQAVLIADTRTIVPGKAFKVGVDLRMDAGWHTYYKESGDAGMPTKVIWNVPQGFKVGALEWQKPERFNDSGIVTYGYKDQTLIAATVTPPATLPVGKPVTISGKVKWLTCKEICLPGSQDVSLTLPVSTSAAAALPENSEKFALVGFDGVPTQDIEPAAATNGGGSILDKTLHVEGSSEKPMSLWAYLALAFVGGFILNFMPCVLPVISIKVLSFVQQAGESPKRVLQLGLTFTAGIISSFMTLAAVVIAVQQAGQNVGWGFQFQYPGFVVAMSVLVTLLALSLFGLFYVSVPAGQGTVDKLASKEGFGGTFFKGVLATILATPCTAPFLGTALGFAFSQPWWVTASIFLSISLGTSFPYLLLTANPKWMRFIPRPGVWMETFKESLGFILLATVLWLLFILGKQLGVDALIWTTAFLLSVAFAAWFISRLTDLNSSRQRKYVVWAIAMMVVLGSYSVCLTKVFGIQPETEKLQPAQASVVPSAGALVWEPFSVQKLDQELNANKTVFIDFTADWCLTCKVNEETVINTAPVISKMKALNVVTMKADWTKQNPDITKILQKFGRSGVPLYVIFPAGKPTEPIVLPEVITQEIVLDKLKEAGPSS